MAKKSSRLMSNEVDAIIAAQKVRLDLKRAQKARREAKLKAEITKVEQQLAKEKAKLS